MSLSTRIRLQVDVNKSDRRSVLGTGPEPERRKPDGYAWSEPGRTRFDAIQHRPNSVVGNTPGPSPPSAPCQARNAEDDPRPGTDGKHRRPAEPRRACSPAGGKFREPGRSSGARHGFVWWDGNAGSWGTWARNGSQGGDRRHGVRGRTWARPRYASHARTASISFHASEEHSRRLRPSSCVRGSAEDEVAQVLFHRLAVTAWVSKFRLSSSTDDRAGNARPASTPATRC